MASQAFSLDSEGQESTAVTVGAGESVRVRITKRTGTFRVKLRIAANSVDSFVTINEDEAWVTGATIEGDLVSVIAQTDDTGDLLTGIIETFT